LATKKHRVLMSCVNMYPGHAYLPYHWALFKTEMEREPLLASSLEWLDPIYLAPPSLKQVCKTVDLSTVDVLLLSLYEWNTLFSMDLAAAVREANPRALIVAGGPDVRWRDADWFRRWPQLDACIKGDGESPLKDLLIMHVTGSGDMKNISGLMLPGPDNTTIHTGEPARHKFDDEVSPYLEQSAHLERMLAGVRSRLDNKHMWVVLETNRGCPYTCTFCDWSTAATGSKVRRVDRDRIMDEIEWFAKNRIPNVYIADANFGIVPRDLDITKQLVKCREQYGYPELVFFNPAKNNTDRIVEIIDTLHAAGMMRFSLNINFQTTDPEALKVMRRENISDPEIQLDLVNRFRERGLPVGSSLILGCPGETRESWFKTTNDMLEKGFHDEVRVFNWLMLPNSPAMDPGYISKYKLKYVNRTTQFNHLAKSHVSKYLGRSQFLVSSYSYNIDDWVEMTIYTALFAASHVLGLTKHVAMYMRELKQVPYETFYTGLYTAWKNEFSDVHAKMEAHFRKFLEDEEALYNINLLDEMTILIEHEEFVFMNMILDKDRFYSFLKNYLATLVEVDTEIQDLVHYQKEMMIDPSYNPVKGKIIDLRWNWYELFKRMHRNDDTYKIVHRQAKLTRLVIKANATGTYGDIDLSFAQQTRTGRKLRLYIEEVLGHRNARANRTYHNPDETRLINVIDPEYGGYYNANS